jgi:hypothetical protein
LRRLAGINAIVKEQEKPARQRRSGRDPAHSAPVLRCEHATQIAALVDRLTAFGVDAITDRKPAVSSLCNW